MELRGVELIDFKCRTEGFLVWNCGCFGVEKGFYCLIQRCVELRGFRCGTEEFWC